MSARQTDLVLIKARVLTMDPALPQTSAVAVAGDRIVWVGDSTSADAWRGPATRIIDCQGHTLIPGLIDAHIHLFPLAASSVGVDCSPRSVRSIADIQKALADRAATTPEGAWVRGWGYDEFYLSERRHPDRWDLDIAVPHRPVRLRHRSGHASALNSVALRRLGISLETPEPPGGVIERDLSTDEPTGFFLEMEDDLTARGVPALSDEELRTGLTLAFQRLLSSGITSVHEATPTGAMAQWELLERLKGGCELPVRVHKMVALQDLPELQARDLFFGAGDTSLSVGAVKIMLNETGRPVLPDRETLRAQVYEAHRAGYQVAFHAVEEAGIEAALDAVDDALRHSALGAGDIAAFGLRLQDHRHRIEHCGVCPPALAQRLRSLGMLVVTQPGFIAEHGERYLADVPRERRRWLYPIESLRRAGVRVAFGSDAPYAPPDPWAAMGAAVTRRASGGAVVVSEEGVAPGQALEMFTAAGAFAASDERDRGAITPGRLADMVLLDQDPLAVEVEKIKDVRVLRTIVGGAVAWEG